MSVIRQLELRVVDLSYRSKEALEAIMQMLYNSDSYAVVQFDYAGEFAASGEGSDEARRGGFEIVDKFARKEIFIDGAIAKSFKEGVDALIESGPTEEEIDEYIARYTQLATQPVVLH